MRNRGYKRKQGLSLRMQIKEIFSKVPDYRKYHKFKLHLLSDILLLSLCATLSGAETDEEIETYGKEKESFLKNFLDLPHGIPSHDTITRVFRFLDSKHFARCLYAHTSEVMDFLKEQHIAMDGKILRGTDKKGRRKSGICIVTAWLCEQCLCLGQLKTSEKSSEKTAIPQLTEEIEIENATVSIDAIANSPAIAGQIVDKKGDYILSLKKNQKSVFEQVSNYMASHRTLFESDRNIDFGSGRIETRTCYVTQNLTFTEGVLAWKGIQSIVMIHARREMAGVAEEQFRFYLSSKNETARYFNKRVRGHWSVENLLHWHLDLSFNEDNSKTRMGNGAENHNTLRKIALQILQQQNDKHSIRERRKKAGWNNQYLADVIQNGFT